MQAEKLKEQLRNTLMERKREAKKAFDMAGAFSKDAASRPAGGGRVGRKGDDSTIKVPLTNVPCLTLIYTSICLCWTSAATNIVGLVLEPPFLCWASAASIFVELVLQPSSLLD